MQTKTAADPKITIFDESDIKAQPKGIANEDNEDLIRTQDLYNEMVECAVKCSRYKQIAHLLSFDFIDAYDISLQTHSTYDEVKCIQARLKFRR